MGVRGLWQVSATALGLLIMVNLVLSALGELPWLVLSLVALAAMMFFCFRQGANLGHGASGVLSNVRDVRQSDPRAFEQLDRKYLSQAWSVSNGVRGVLAGALAPYAVGGVYIILTLLSWRSALFETPATVARVAAWILSLPYWPIVMRGHEDFVQLTPDIAALLLISPFVLPLCTFAGYMQGPKLWARSEEAMRQGRRRAKARARVGKKMAPKVQKPEI